MRLIDCFLPVFSISLEYADKIRSNNAPNIEEIQLDLEKALAENESKYVQGQYAEKDYLIAKFAIVVFVDELFLCLDWPGKTEWGKQRLQFKHFKKTVGGETFFTELNQLSPLHLAAKDIREVYYYCLQLGFKGRYYHLKDQPELQKIKENNYQLLIGDQAPLSGEDALPICPEAFPEENPEPFSKKHFNPRFNLKPFYIGLPALLLIVLYFFFQSEINETANQILNVL